LLMRLLLFPPLPLFTMSRLLFPMITLLPPLPRMLLLFPWCESSPLGGYQWVHVCQLHSSRAVPLPLRLLRLRQQVFVFFVFSLILHGTFLVEQYFCSYFAARVFRQPPPRCLLSDAAFCDDPRISSSKRHSRQIWPSVCAQRAHRVRGPMRFRWGLWVARPFA